MSENNPQLQADQAYKSLLYWRKSLLAGTQCVPVIMTLERDVLSMKTSDGVVVFAVSRSERTVKFTGWGTMLVTVGEKRYDFVGMPASESPAVSKSQIEELAQVGDGTGIAKDITKTSTLNAVATGTIASGAPSVAGAAASTGMYYHGLTSMYEWKALIGSAADQKRRFNNMTYAILLIVIILVVAIALK